MPSKRLQDLQARANAAAQVEKLRVETRDDVVNAETRADIKRLSGVIGTDVSASSTRSTNDADKMVPMYHAYDGRTIRVPMYQVEDRLMRTFDRTDEIPQEYWGKQVWVLSDEERTAEPEAGEFQCRLSPNAPDETKAEMKAAGLNSNCRKRLKYGGFATQFEADEHFRVKHPRRWKSYQTWQGLNASRSSSDGMTKAIEQLTAIAVAQAGGNKPAA